MSGHDGSAFEVLSTEWLSVCFFFLFFSVLGHADKIPFLQRGSAKNLGLRNRPQRLLEYAEQRTAVLCDVTSSSSKVLGKRRRKVETQVSDKERSLLRGRTIVFGFSSKGEPSGYAFLFPVVPSFR